MRLLSLITVFNKQTKEELAEARKSIRRLQLELAEARESTNTQVQDIEKETPNPMGTKDWTEAEMGLLREGVTIF